MWLHCAQACPCPESHGRGVGSLVAFSVLRFPCFSAILVCSTRFLFLPSSSSTCHARPGRARGSSGLRPMAFLKTLQLHGMTMAPLERSAYFPPTPTSLLPPSSSGPPPPQHLSVGTIINDCMDQERTCGTEEGLARLTIQQQAPIPGPTHLNVPACITQEIPL